MEACVICRAAKPKARKGKILFCNAINEVTRERAQSFLTDAHIEHIVSAYRDFADVSGFAQAELLDDIRENDGNLGIPLYIAPANTAKQDRAAYGAGAGWNRLSWIGWIVRARFVRLWKACLRVIQRGIEDILKFSPIKSGINLDCA